MIEWIWYISTAKFFFLFNFQETVVNIVKFIFFKTYTYIYKETIFPNVVYNSFYSIYLEIFLFESICSLSVVYCVCRTHVHVLLSSRELEHVDKLFCTGCMYVCMFLDFTSLISVPWFNLFCKCCHPELIRSYICSLLTYVEAKYFTRCSL